MPAGRSTRSRPGTGSRTTPVEAGSEAMDHLRGADPALARLVETYGSLDTYARRRGRPDDPYGTLIRSIIGQQVSTKAAAAIWGRLLELFGGRVPEPAELLARDPEEIRAVGLSRQKLAYLRDLAARVEDGDLDLDALRELPDGEVAEQLTEVKGIGRWSAEIFLLFHLGRPDVLPVGDLGIRRAVRDLHGLDELPAPAELERIAEPWRPHRSLACLYLWRSLDNEPA